LHHYFPALYFAILTFGYFIDHVSRRIGRVTVVYFVSILIGLTVIGNFVYFAPFAFGFKGSAAQYSGRRWLSAWNIHD